MNPNLRLPIAVIDHVICNAAVTIKINQDIAWDDAYAAKVEEIVRRVVNSEFWYDFTVAVQSGEELPEDFFGGSSFFKDVPDRVLNIAYMDSTLPPRVEKN